METYKINHAIILAGGFGKRLRAEIQNVPKPMALINNKPFLEILLNYLDFHCVSNVTLAIGYKRDVIKKYFDNKFKNISLYFSEEDDKFPLGTGGAVINSLNNMPENAPFLVLNGDTFFNFDLQDFSKKCHTFNADVGFALMYTKDDRYGKVYLNKRGHVQIPSEINAFNNSEAPAIGGTFYFRKKKLFENVKTTGFLNLEKNILPSIRCNYGRFFGKIYNNDFIDIGTPSDYHKASDLKSIQYFSNY